MTSSPTRHRATHERIVEVAARALRREGYAGVGVAGVMAEAGLTHGGFYAHFASRDAMLVEAIERAGRDSGARMADRIERRRARGLSAFRALVEQYLSEAHLAGVEQGCVVAALGSEIPRQTDALRDVSAARVRGLVATVERALPPEVDPREAQAIAGTLVGSLQLARALGRAAEAKALLASARRSLLARYEPC